MIVIIVSVYVLIGVVGYIWWGDSEKLITGLYWIVIWPHMAVWTILANKKEFLVWIRSKGIKSEWKKIKDYFKIDITGEK